MTIRLALLSCSLRESRSRGCLSPCGPRRPQVQRNGEKLRPIVGFACGNWVFGADARCVPLPAEGTSAALPSAILIHGSLLVSMACPYGARGGAAAATVSWRIQDLNEDEIGRVLHGCQLTRGMPTQSCKKVFRTVEVSN